MISKLVSIIIPAWNAEKYIKEAIDSALNQTHPNTEVIVVNDGSTDGTESILKSYQNPKLRYFNQENQGLAGARNTGIKNSQGEYIALLDSDDIFLPSKVERQAEILEDNPDYGICYSDLLHFNDPPDPARFESRSESGGSPSGTWRAGESHRKFFHHRYRYPSGDIFGEIIHRQFINPLAVMIRRGIFNQFGLFDQNLRRSEDWELWLRLAKNGVKFYYLNEVLAHYRVRSIGNLSSLESEPEMKEKNLEIFTRLAASLTLLQKKQYRFYKILKKLRLKVVFASLIVGDRKKALFFVRELSPSWKFLVSVLPVAFWKFFLRFIRKIKHRLLLKKM